MLIWDLDLLVLRTDHNKILLIELLWKQHKKKNSYISVHIQFILLCLKICLVLATWPRNFQRYCSLISSIIYQRSWVKSKKSSKKLKVTLLIWDHQCHLNLIKNSNFCGVWSLNLLHLIKTQFQVNTMPSVLEDNKVSSLVALK